MSEIKTLSTTSPSSSTRKPWKSWIYSKRTRADNDPSDAGFVDRENLSFDVPAEPEAAASSVAVVYRSWRVGAWRRETNRYQKRPEKLPIVDGVVRRDGATPAEDLEEEMAERGEHRAEITRGRQEREEKETEWRAEAALIEKYTVHDDATLVTCAAGLEVWHVVAGFNLCKLKIKNLPKATKESEITDILAEQNVPFPEFFVTRPHTMKDTGESTVLVGKEVCLALALELDGLVFRGQVLRVEVSDHTTRHAMLFTEQSSPFLTVSWNGQTDTLIASYPSNDEAVKRANELNGMFWKGQRLAASLNQHQRASPSYTKSVKITRYPPEATSETEFLDFIGTHAFRILKTKPYNHQCTLIMVRIHLRQQHGVKMDTYEELTSTVDFDDTKVTVQFNDWDDVKRAYGVFHRRKLGSGEETTPTLRASYPRPCQFSIKISRRQFLAQQKQWNALKETTKQGETYFCTSQQGDNVILYVLGDDRRTTGTLKVRVEKLALGEALDGSHWHSDFANNNKAFFKRVLAKTGVHIKIESRVQFLRIFGDPDKVAQACSLIKAEVIRLRSMEARGDDKRADYEKASGLDLTGDRGWEGEGNDRLIEYSFPEDRSEMWTPRKASCVVCYCEASEPEHLGCGHVYCAECLRHHLASAADAQKFPITCIGNDATCNTPLPIPVIRRFVDNRAFQHLVEGAFTFYLERHREEYRYCTTPECKQIYRLSQMDAWQCPSCFLKICPVCKEVFHEGLTCEQRRLQHDPALLEQLKESLGYRKCPRCNAWIEKAGGCNHITCKCGSHICWRCMGHFQVTEISKHLSKMRCKAYKPPVQTQKSINRVILSMQADTRCPQEFLQSREREPKRCVVM